MTGIRKCKGCGSSRPETLEFFKPTALGRGGLQGKCRTCANASSRRWKAEHSVELAAKRRLEYAGTKGLVTKAKEAARALRSPRKIKANAMLSGVRARSAERGESIPSWATVSAVEAWLEAQPECECCGVTFELGRSGTKMKSDTSPSIDRFNNALGYTHANVRLICWRCNNIKRNYSAADLRMVAAWMEATPQPFAEAA